MQKPIIYITNPQKVFRIKISNKTEDTRYLSVINTEIDEALLYFKKLLLPHELASKDYCNLQVREAIGGQNGKCSSTKIYGRSPKFIYDKIIADLGESI